MTVITVCSFILKGPGLSDQVYPKDLNLVVDRLIPKLGGRPTEPRQRLNSNLRKDLYKMMRKQSRIVVQGITYKHEEELVKPRNEQVENKPIIHSKVSGCT
jgi:hypothetical protein